MRKPYRFAFAFVGLIFFAAISWQVGHSQSDTQEFFPSKHSVEGAFLDFYHAVQNPELVYGYPITEAFTDRDGLRVQYFQRARFELQPVRGVVLTPIGAALYEPGRPVSEFNPSAGACRNFETGFRVCTVFLDFFTAHGGEAQFGRPISDVEQDGIRKIQYFEYARLEWYPENNDPVLEIQPGQLGRLFFDLNQEDPNRLRGVTVSGIIEITTIQLHAFSSDASMRGNGVQSVFIIVQDQTHAPVEGLELMITVHYPIGSSDPFPAVTNALGFIELDVPVNPGVFGEGRVTVSATAEFSGNVRTAQTSFWSNP